MKDIKLSNLFLLNPKNDAAPETNVTEVPLASPSSGAQAAVEDGQDKSAGYKKSSPFSFFGKKDKVSKAELHAKILEMQAKEEADGHSYTEEKQTLEAQLAEMKDNINLLEKKQEVRDKENAALQLQITEMESQHEAVVAEHDKTKETLESKVADLERTIAEMNTIVIKRLELIDAKFWHGYSTLDKDETPTKLSMNSSNELIINGIFASPAKKLVLDGFVTDFAMNPFEGKSHAIHSIKNDAKNVSRLLEKVQSCKVTDLLLWYQHISWNEYQKLVSSQMVNNFYFIYVGIKYEDGVYVPLENILQMLPNLKRFYYREPRITKETFKKLVKCPTFKKLEIFKLAYLHPSEFDVEAFVEFMKKHPAVHFTLHFYNASDFEAVKQKIKALSSHRTHLKIENQAF